MKKRFFYLLLFLLLLDSKHSLAQSPVEMADVFYQSGKIYVVVAVVLIVLTGLYLYLISIDKKVKKLEENINLPKTEK